MEKLILSEHWKQQEQGVEKSVKATSVLVHN